MAGVSPIHVTAAAMAVFGIGLMASAFMGDDDGTVRLLFGVGLFVTAFITAGLQLLNRHGAKVPRLGSSNDGREDA